MNVLRSINQRIRHIAAIVVLLTIVASNATGVAAAANLSSAALAGMAAGSNCSVGASGATYTKIQDAVNDAGCATITIAAGTYQENVTISRDVTINGAGASSTFVDGGGSGCATPYRCTVFKISQPIAVTFSGLTIRNGWNGSGYAGGIDIQAAANVTVQNSIVANNYVTYPYGGAGINFNANSGTLTVSNSTFSGNISARRAAAIFNPGATMSVLNSTFSGNGDSGYGVEGSAILTAGPTTVKNSTFIGNKGMGALYVGDSTTTVINSTFSNNQAGPYDGGAIYVGSGNLSVSSSTFSDNGAARGGAIMLLAGRGVTLKSTILANNSGGNCEVALGYSLTDGGSNLRWPSTDSSCFGRFGDPKLAALADNGGATQTMALQAGSAAIDTGACTDTSGATIVTDQRRMARPADGDSLGPIACDVGAYEAPADTNPNGSCYAIQSQQTGYVLDVYGGSTAAGTAVIVWPQKTPAAKNQLWTITPDGYIKSQQTGYVLDVKSASTSPGAPVIVWRRNSPATNNQLWNLVLAPSCG